MLVAATAGREVAVVQPADSIFIAHRGTPGTERSDSGKRLFKRRRAVVEV